MENWNYKSVWNEAMSQFSSELDENEFSMWFNIEYLTSSKGTVHIKVPSLFCKDHLVKKYKAALEDRLFELSNNKIAIDFVIGDISESAEKEHQNKVVADKPSISPQLKTSKHPQLNDKYSFDNYIIGENNRFAANAAIAIASNQGVAYNPVLIYGDVGLGKTHLMQAIGNKVWSTNQKVKIICVSAEAFTNDFIQSIRSKEMHAFKNRYRSVDILLIDDIHFFENKEGSQEELFHTFNALYDSNKQMVFTCDRPPHELKNLSDRLRSRFERGLNVDLQPPNYETRYAILKTKAEMSGLKITPEVFDVIAKNISTNIRDLEAALTKLGAYSKLINADITLDVAQNQLRDMFSHVKHGNITIETIIRAVADEYKLTVSDIKAKKRTRSIVVPRQIAMYITKEITEYSTTETGLAFGGRDHTTVMHSCQKVDEQLKLDPTLDGKIQKIIQTIKQMSIK